MGSSSADIEALLVDVNDPSDPTPGMTATGRRAPPAALKKDYTGTCAVRVRAHGSWAVPAARA